MTRFEFDFDFEFEPPLFSDPFYLLALRWYPRSHSNPFTSPSLSPVLLRPLLLPARGPEEDAHFKDPEVMRAAPDERVKKPSTLNPPSYASGASFSTSRGSST